MRRALSTGAVLALLGLSGCLRDFTLPPRREGGAPDRSSDERAPDHRADDRPRRDQPPRDRVTPPDLGCPSPCVTTFAGANHSAHINGPLAQARFVGPAALAIDPPDALLVADEQDNRVRRIAGGQVSTLAGSGAHDHLDGPAATAALTGPLGITIDLNGGVLVSDRNSVRRIAAGQVTTVAGRMAPGMVDGPAAEAFFCHPSGMAFDGSGGLLIADWCNYRVRRLFAGEVSTFAGSIYGKSDGPISTATLGGPTDLVVDAAGTVYVADLACIRRIANGQMQTFAGTCSMSWGFADGLASSARFHTHLGIALDVSGGLLVADSGNHRIRRVAGGVVTTIAGDGSPGYLDGPTLSARFNEPSDVVALGPAIFVADRLNHCIRRIQ